MTSTFSPHQRALKLQKKIFRSLKLEADLLLGKTPDSIIQYEKEARADFQPGGPYENLSKVELIESVRTSDVTFIADFHAFDQSQEPLFVSCVKRFVRAKIG